MKLLSICVPTYNRNKELAELVHHFLIPALDTYSNLIEVVVCDNSDSDIAEINWGILDARIHYHKNEVNIGFAGNLICCAREASGTFIWIISDDDPILWDGFKELMETLPQASVDGIDCLMLPFQTTNNFGDTVFSNQHINWNAERTTQTASLLNSGQVPFVLFSSAVIRLDKSILDGLESKFFNNDYLQIIMFLEMLNIDSPILFLTTSTIDYQPEYKCRFSIISLADSMSEIRQFVFDKFQIVKNKKKDYRQWLIWMVHHRGGLYRFKDGDNELWLLLSRSPHNLDLKNIILAFTLVGMPKCMFKPLYIWYRSFTDMRKQGRFSLTEFRMRISNYMDFLTKNLNRST